MGSGCEDRGRAVCNRREPEAAGDLRGEGKEEGGEIPGPDQAAEHQAERVGLSVRVRRDEHHQASPQIDELEDEIIREKLKINAVSGQLDDTFNEMLNKYKIHLDLAKALMSEA